MKYHNLITRPTEVNNFMRDHLDDDIYTNDWAKKAQRLQIRRWRKIEDHSMKVGHAVFRQQQRYV